MYQTLLKWCEDDNTLTLLSHKSSNQFHLQTNNVQHRSEKFWPLPFCNADCSSFGVIFPERSVSTALNILSTSGEMPGMPPDYSKKKCDYDSCIFKQMFCQETEKIIFEFSKKWFHHTEIGFLVPSLPVGGGGA